MTEFEAKVKELDRFVKEKYPELPLSSFRCGRQLSVVESYLYLDNSFFVGIYENWDKVVPERINVCLDELIDTLTTLKTKYATT